MFWEFIKKLSTFVRATKRGKLPARIIFAKNPDHLVPCEEEFQKQVPFELISTGENRNDVFRLRPQVARGLSTICVAETDPYPLNVFEADDDSDIYTVASLEECEEEFELVVIEELAEMTVETEAA